LIFIENVIKENTRNAVNQVIAAARGVE